MVTVRAVASGSVNNEASIWTEQWRVMFDVRDVDVCLH